MDKQPLPLPEDVERQQSPRRKRVAEYLRELLNGFRPPSKPSELEPLKKKGPHAELY